VPLEHDTQTSLVVYKVGKPVVVTRTRGSGQPWHCSKRADRFLRAPGDGDGVAGNAAYHNHPREAARMGHNTRRVMEEGLNLDSFIAGLRLGWSRRPLHADWSPRHSAAIPILLT